MPRRRAPLRVLIVEDNASVRAFIAEALGGAAEVTEAGDADEALAHLTSPRGPRLDLVIVDCILPTRRGLFASGVDLVRTVRSRWPWVPVVAITGALDAERLLREAQRVGASHVLQKPFGIPEITEALARVLPRRPPRPGGDIAMQRVIAFVGEHYTEPLALRDLAQMASMSRSHFCRMFRHAAGVSFRDYIRNLRLRRAQELLRRPKASLTAIALEVGFYDLAHFDKAFRKQYGVSPSEFLRRRGLPRGSDASRPDATAS
jgi:AraC-like DNA-binding protein